MGGIFPGYWNINLFEGTHCVFASGGRLLAVQLTEYWLYELWKSRLSQLECKILNWELYDI